MNGWGSESFNCSRNLLPPSPPRPQHSTIQTPKKALKVLHLTNLRSSDKSVKYSFETESEIQSNSTPFDPFRSPIICIQLTFTSILGRMPELLKNIPAEGQRLVVYIRKKPPYIF